jgi:hypothetical protein
VARGAAGAAAAPVAARGRRRLTLLRVAALAALLCAVSAPAPAARASGQVPFAPGSIDQPPLVSPQAPLADEAPPQPLGRRIPPGPDRGSATRAGAVLPVRALFAAGGGGGRTLTRAISDSRVMESLDGGVRARAMALTRGLGASLVRLQMSWRGALPAAPPRDAADPADPAYDWAPQDAAVRDAVAAGLTPMLVVAHAPPYAEAPRRWRFSANGSWAPRPSELAAFATAVARRYSGRWPDPARAGRTLPRVAWFQAWNEPNLPRYLSPQWVVRGGRWVAWAPGHYRRMLNAFAAAVRAVQPDATIVSAGLAPNGESADGAGRMTPIRFLRALLMKKTDADVFAFHPLSVGEPDVPARSSLDVSVADVAKLSAVLRAAARRGVVPRAPRLWITELNWTTAAIPAARRAAAVGRGLHRLWAAGARMVTWHFLEDPSGTAGRHAGLRHRGARGPLTGKVKAYARGFALPLDAARVGRARVAVWAVPRAAGVLRVEVARGGGRWRVVARVAGAARDRPARVTVRARAGARLRVVSGGLASAALRVR